MRTLMILLLLLPALAVRGQGLFDAGVKGGVSRDNILFTNVADFKAITGWQAGVFARVKPPLAPGVQAELLLNTLGTDLRPADTLAGEAAIRLRYLQLPVFLVFALGPAEVHLGVYASQLLNSSIDQPTVMYQEVQQLREDEFVNIDHGLLGGLGFKFGRVYAGARYLVGLGNMGSGSNHLLGRARSTQAQFYLGYGFVR
jgi:hypothetical protein